MRGPCAFATFEDFHGFGPHRMRHRRPHHCHGDTEEHFGPHGHRPWGPSPWERRDHGRCHGPHGPLGHPPHHHGPHFHGHHSHGHHFHGHHSHGPHHGPRWSRHFGPHHDDHHHDGPDHGPVRGPFHYGPFKGPFGHGPCGNRGPYNRPGTSACGGNPCCNDQAPRPPKKNKPSCSKNKEGNTETVLLQRIVVEHPERSYSV